MAEHTYLVCAEQAGYDILFALMMADGHTHDNELAELERFFRTERVKASALFDHKLPFHQECNFKSEYAFLKSLKPAELERRFIKAAEHLAEWIPAGSPDEGWKRDLLEHARALVHADGELHPREEALIAKLRGILGG